MAGTERSVLLAGTQIPDAERNRSLIATALGLGSQLLAGMLVCAGTGYYVDHRRGGGSVGTLIGMFAGMLYGGYEVWKLVRNLSAEDRKKTEKKQ